MSVSLVACTVLLPHHYHGWRISPGAFNGAVSCSHTNSVLTTVTSKHHAYGSVVCQVITPSLLAAGWSADHKEMATFFRSVTSRMYDTTMLDDVWQQSLASYPQDSNCRGNYQCFSRIQHLSLNVPKSYTISPHQSDLVTCQWSRSLTSLQDKILKGIKGNFMKCDWYVSVQRRLGWLLVKANCLEGVWLITIPGLK